MQRVHSIMWAASACARLQKSRIGVIGGLFHNLVSCRYDPQSVSDRLGTTLLPITYDELSSAIRSISQFQQDMESLQRAITPLDALDAANRDATEAGITLHLALKRIAQENKIDGFAIECWTGLPREIGLNPCLGFIEDAYTLACEGDVMMCISLLIARYLSGSSAFAGDLYDLDLDGILTLVHCGAPASLASSNKEVILGKSLIAQELGFETVTCRPRLDPGPVTLFRLYGSGCDQLHMASAELLSSEQSPNLVVRLKLDGDRWVFLENCFGNHYVVVARDIRDELKLLGKWLGITIFDT
jgi:L-fucose isomerase-like protein